MLPSEWIFRFAAYVRGHNAMLTMAEAVTLGRAAAEDGHWLSHGPEEVAEQALRDVMGGSKPAQFIDTVPDVFEAQSQS